MLILLYGPFAVGKTQATERLLEEWPAIDNLRVINADNNRMMWRVGKARYSIKTDGWQGKIAQKSQLLRDCMADDDKVYVVESGRPDGEKYIAPYHCELGGGVYVVYALTTAVIMKKHLIDRCNMRGKTFNAGFWTKPNLWDNALERPMRQCAQYLVPNHVPHRIFCIDYERKAWDLVLSHIWFKANRPDYMWYGDIGVL